MASSDGDSAIKIVDSADVGDDRPLVKVESVERASLFSFLTGLRKGDDEEVKTQDSKHTPPQLEQKEPEPVSHTEVVHEGEGIRSSYDVEEDVPPSLLEQVKRKVHWNGR